MAIFLVDLEFREKAKSLLTSRELAACVFLLLLALLPWAEVIVSACTIYIYTSLLSLHLVGNKIVGSPRRALMRILYLRGTFWSVSHRPRQGQAPLCSRNGGCKGA